VVAVVVGVVAVYVVCVAAVDGVVLRGVVSFVVEDVVVVCTAGRGRHAKLRNAVALAVCGRSQGTDAVGGVDVV